MNNMFLAIYDDNSFTCTESGEMPDPYDETVFYICRKMRGLPGYYTTRMICPPVKQISYKWIYEIKFFLYGFGCCFG